MLTRRTGPDRKEFVTTRPAARPPDKIRKRLGWALALALRPGSSWSRCGSAIHQPGRLLPTAFAITPTLRTPPLFALRAGPIVLTAMPTPPVPGRLLASCTAITTLRLTRVEPPFTALQKTAPPPQAPPRSASENSPVLPHAHSISLGCGPFGRSSTLGAHRPPQLAAAPQTRRQTFRILCVKQISCHSADTFANPRNRNLRIPRAALIWPNTGSTMCLRAA